MKKLLMLGTSNISCHIVEYAKSRGIYTIVTDYLEPERSVAKLIADEYWMINTANVDELEVKCREEGVTAVISGILSFNIEKGMELARRLQLPYYCTKEAWDLTGDVDKALFKKICLENGAAVATDYFLTDNPTDEELDSVHFPVVVKPVDGKANVGVSFCYNKEDLRKAFELVHKVSENPKMVVEKLIKGEEWYSSYAIVNGQVRFLALNAMYWEPGYPTNCYTITTTVSNHIEQFLEEINPQIETVLKKIGCTNGYAWVQVMRDEETGKFVVIESGYRFDGDMMFMPIKDITGYDSVKAMVDYHCGLESEGNPLPPPQKHAFTKCGCGHMFWTKKAGTISKVEGVDEIKKLIPGVYVECRRRPGDTFDAYRPLGTITYTAKDCEEFCKYIDIVNKTIKIFDETGEDVIIKYTNFDYLKKVYQEGLEGK